MPGRPVYPVGVIARLLAITALLLATVAFATGCGDSQDRAAGGSTTAPSTASVEDHTHPEDEPTPTSGADILFPPAPAPEFGLRDHLGNEISIEQFRGKAVFVTFVYASCPDICPLIVANLRRTLDRLGPRAEDVQVVAVSVDPEGDTPELITTYLRSQKMTGRMVWLVGSRHDLEHAWTRWGIATRIPRSNPDLVEHAAPIYGINTEGTISTIYDHTFLPKDLLRDVPELLGT